MNEDATRAATRSRRWALGAATWMMLVPTCLVAVRLAVPSDHLRVDTLAGSMVRGAIVHPAGSVARIRDGDVVLAVDGRRMDELVRAAQHRGVHAGERLVYRVRRDGLERDVMVTVGARARLIALLTPELAGFAIAFAMFGLAVWLVRRRPEERAAHALLILAAALASGEIAYTGTFEPLDVWARPQLVGWSVATGWTFMQMGLATLLLAWTFPAAPRGFARHPWTAAALIPLAVVLVEGVMVATGRGSAQLIDDANFVIGWWFWGATMAAALIVAAVRCYRLRRDHLARRRMQIAALGLSVSGAVLLLETVTAVDIPDVLYLPGLACFPIAIAIAVSRRDWFELDVTLNRGLVATICGVVLLILYLATALLTAQLTDGAGPLVALPAAGLVAVCFAPVRWRAQRFIDHRLFGTGGDPRLVFHRLGVRLAASDDPESLMAAVVLTATESLRLDYAAVQLRAGDAWQTVYERGRCSDDLATFDMIAGDSVVGRLVAAPRRDVKTLSPVDRELLADLASHSGVAARVAALVTELRIAQQRLLVAREAERHRIHRDLHDSVGPSLVGLTLQLEVVAEMAQQTDWGELIARLHREAARTTRDCPTNCV